VHSKPAPDGYLLAAERLGVEPADCLVFEDTDLGIRSATAAGMASVKVPSPMERRLNGRMEPIASLVRMGSQEEISSKG
jgi:beta-phosphoglucomutase-like phosphatase (HAD superfamily)